MSGVSAVLFDLDGTLTDSRLGILRSARYACEKLGQEDGRRYPLPDDSELGWVIGPPLRDSFARLVGGEHVERLMTFYLERYAVTGAFENSVYDGIPEALDALRAGGIRLYVATSKNEVNARQICDHFGLTRRFEAIHGAGADGGRADKTELLAHLLGQHALVAGRDRIAMVGDRKFDAIGARNVGVAAIGAQWGYGGEEELRAAGADPILAAPSQVPDAVRALFALTR
jgi:phosphoglycolate phosphatase